MRILLNLQLLKVAHKPAAYLGHQTMASQTDFEDFSSIPEVVVPEFQSQIPDYLLENADDQTRFIIQSLSTQTQTMRWLCQLGAEQNVQLRRLEGRNVLLEQRMAKLEGWKDKVISFWPITIGLVTIISSITMTIFGLIDLVKKP